MAHWPFTDGRDGGRGIRRQERQRGRCRCRLRGERLEDRRLLATLYWDADGIAANNNITTGAGLGGSGVWRTGGTANWFNPTTKTNVAWAGTATDTAVFFGTVGTVSVSGAVAVTTATFQTSGYGVQPALDGGSLILSGVAATFTVTAGSATIGTTISGTASLTKAGAGTLVLTTSASYTGQTTVQAGILDVRGNLASQVTVSGGSVANLVFFDPDLAAAVRETLGMPSDTVLTPANVSPLTSLTVDSNRISDLTGLKPATTPNLAALSLVPDDFSVQPERLASLASLAGLANLKSLTLQHCGLTDAVLTTLPALAAVETLDLRGNTLTAIPAAVANLPGLSRLFVHGNQSLTDSPRLGLAALKGKPIDVDVAADRPDAARTASELAAALYFLPTKIHEYVTNTILFQPYTGLMKGPLATLQTKSGNDWDTNALLAAVFAAAGVPTRYVAGTIEITGDQLRDYVGARTTTAAVNILAQAGLRFDQFANHLTHTWLEAQVRLPGATQATWIPLDASWKFRDLRPGLPNMLASVPFDPREADYLTQPAWQKQSAAEYYESKVAAWLAANRPDLSVADVAYDGPIRQQSFAALPGALPYVVLSQPAEASRPTTPPASAAYSVQIQLTNGATTLVNSTLSLADIALKRIAIDPGLDATGTLARPALRLDGVVQAQAATTLPAATSLSLTISIKAPAGVTSYSRSFVRTADRCIAIGLDANQFTEALLVEKRATANAEQLNRANGLAVDRDRAVGGLLDLAIASYFTAADADEAALAGLTAAIPDRTAVAIGIATSGPTLATTATAGLQHPYLPADMGIDVPGNVVGGMAIDDGLPAQSLMRTLLMGYANSALEGLVLEELTNFESVSTIKAFQLAVSAGGLASLVEITKANVGNIATLLPGVRAEIRTAIASTVTNGLVGLADYAGVTFTALVPTTELTVGGGAAGVQWKGVGYTLTIVTTDPADPRNGKTVGFIIHGAVGSQPLRSYGGGTSWWSVAPPALTPSVPVNNPANYLGDPINLASGNVYHDETDIEIPNLGVPLAFRRHYDSAHTVSGLTGAPAAWSDRGLGEGWSFTYSDRIETKTDGSATWFTDAGMRLDFSKTTTGFANPDGVFGTLTGSAAGGFTWTDFQGNSVVFGVAIGSSSPLVRMQDRFGNGIRVDYVTGTSRIAKVYDLKDASRWLSFTYTAVAPLRIATVSDFTGRTWTYAYVGNSLATKTSPVPATGVAAPVVKYAYHADKARQGLLASVTDPLGNVTAWEYYANRRGFRVTDSLGNRHSLTYNLHRRQSAFIDERGNASRYAYDEEGNLLDVRYPDRTVERSTWSANGLKLSATDVYGGTTAYAYDMTAGLMTSSTDALGTVTTWTYTSGVRRDIDTITRLGRPADPSDDVATKCVYDAGGFLTSRIEDYGPGRLNLETRFTAVAGGRGLVQAATSPQGSVTSFTYNSAGQVLTQSVESAPGVTVVQARTYNALGDLVSSTDGNGSITTCTYDSLGRKISETLPDPDGSGPLTAPVTSYVYDAAGNLVATALSDGRTTRSVFDGQQRARKRVAPDGTCTLATYDMAGNTVTQTDAMGRVTRCVYDVRGRLVATVFPDGTTVQARVDGGGRTVAVTDQAGFTTTTAYDRLGRKIREVSPDGATTAWGYDSRGNLQFVTACFAGLPGVAAGDVSYSTHYDYDAVGRKTKETGADPDGVGGPLSRPVTLFSYDRDGNLLAVSDPRGFTTTYAYDQLGRRIRETTPDPDGTGPLLPLVRQMVYDKAGNLRFDVAPGGLNETDTAFTTEHGYDALGREVSTILPDPDGTAGPQARPVVRTAYDSRGFLAATTDPLGRSTSYASDLLGRVKVVTDAMGGVAKTLYDAVGNVLITTDPLGRRTITTYDTMNRPLAVQSPRPDVAAAMPVTTFRYDAVGRLMSTTDPLGHTSWRQYDSAGRVTAVTDALGIGAGDPLHTTRTEYDLAGRVTAVTDQLGRRTDYVYDNLGRKRAMLAPDFGAGRPTTSFGYDAAGNLRYVTDPRGAAAGDASFTTWTFYDGLNRTTAVVDPLGTDWPVTALPETLPGSVTTNVTLSTYDAAGRLAAVTDALGRTTNYAYDNLGRKITETGPAADGSAVRPVTRSAYDAKGNLTSVTDPLGNMTTYAYDGLARRIGVTDALGCTTTTAYDARGNTVLVTDASGNVTASTYDRLDRLVREVDPLGQVTTFAYDLAGNRLRQTDRNGWVTTYLFDAADRNVEERWQQSAAAAVFHTIHRSLDAAGQLLGITETDTTMPAATTQWQFDYDAGGHVVRSRMAPGELLQTPAFSGAPNPPGSLDAADPTLDWDGDGKAERYDGYAVQLAVGDVVVVTGESSAFDPVLLAQKPGGSLATALFDDNAGGGTAASLRFVADVAGVWTIAVTSRSETATGGYGLRIVKDANPYVPQALVQYDFSYDRAGNLTTVRENQAAVADVGGFGKAAAGLGSATAYVYDPLGRVTRYEQTIAGGTVARRADYVYRADDSVATVTRFAGAGVTPVATTTNQYDGLGRLTQIVHAPAAAGSASSSYGYAFDIASRIMSVTTPEGTSTITLDATDQLTSASLTGETYAYDKTGNRTSGGAVNGLSNRLLSDGVYRYGYDGEGNRTAKYRDADMSGTLSIGDTDVTIMGWDQRNRLVSVSHVGGWTAAAAAALPGVATAGLPGSDLELRYSYDAFDRRIRREIDADGSAGAGGRDVSYAAYQGDLRTLELQQAATLTNTAGQVVGILTSVRERTLYGTGTDTVLATERTVAGMTTTFWTLADHQGTVRDIVSGTGGTLGQIVEHRQYDSFGRIQKRTLGPQAGAATLPDVGVGVTFGYAGRPLEERTGLSDNRARWYDPAVGRFTSEDPSGFKGSDANLFRYVGNDPFDRVDPSGLTAKWASYAGKASVPTAGWAGLGQSSTNTFTGRPDWGIPFGEFLVSSSSSTGRSRVSQSGLTVGGLTPGQGATTLVIGIDGTGSAQWLSKVDAKGSLVNERTHPDGTARWNSHVRNLVADCNPYAMTIYSPGPAQTDGGDSKGIFTAVVAAAEAKIRASGGGTTVALVGFSRGGMIGAGVANALVNPPPGSLARQVAFVGMYDPVDMSPTIPAEWARIDPRVKNVTILGPNSGRDRDFNVDYPVGWPSPTDPPFSRMSLNNRITVTGTATNVSRFSYNASHGALGGTPGFNKNHTDTGSYNYSLDVRASIRADQDLRNGMRGAGLEFVPERGRAWYGYPATRPPASVRR